MANEISEELLSIVREEFETREIKVVDKGCNLVSVTVFSQEGEGIIGIFLYRGEMKITIFAYSKVGIEFAKKVQTEISSLSSCIIIER